MLVHCLQTRRKGTSFTRNERRTTHERIAGRFITLKQLQRAPRSPLWKSIKRSEPLMILAVIQLRVAANRNPAEGPARNRTRARVLRISVCCSMWPAIWFLLWNTGLHRVSNAKTKSRMHLWVLPAGAPVGVTFLGYIWGKKAKVDDLRDDDSPHTTDLKKPEALKTGLVTKMFLVWLPGDSEPLCHRAQENRKENIDK